MRRKAYSNWNPLPGFRSPHHAPGVVISNTDTSGRTAGGAVYLYL